MASNDKGDFEMNKKYQNASDFKNYLTSELKKKWPKGKKFTSKGISVEVDQGSGVLSTMKFLRC